MLGIEVSVDHCLKEVSMDKVILMLGVLGMALLRWLVREFHRIP